MPDFQYSRKVQLPDSFCSFLIPAECYAGFVFIDTNFLAYGYGYNNLEGFMLQKTFTRLGWTSEKTGDEQLAYLKRTLQSFDDAAYIFVVGFVFILP